jgi:hypothetical protein
MQKHKEVECLENFIVISNIFSSPEWEQIFNAVIGISNEFDIVYPNGEYDADNPLLAGKLDFEKVSNISVSPWLNMEDSSVYRGVLDDSSKSLILQYALNESDSLWNFSLYKDNVQVLNVQDFNVCLIEPDPELITLLNNNNIELLSLSDW